jgi:quinol monooxygenase YgiN
MYLTMVRVFPKDSEMGAVRGFFANLLGPTRVQSGCLGCSLATESDPDAILYMETWQSEDYLLRRLHSNDYGKVLAVLEASLISPQVCIYEVINQQGLEFVERIRMAYVNGGAAGQ